VSSVSDSAAHVLHSIFSYQFSVLDVPIILTLVLLEGVLSFDNAAVLAVMSRKLPPEQRKKALTYGLVGAYVMRFLAIVFAAVLIAVPVTRLIGGFYLLYLCVKHFWDLRNGAHNQDEEEENIPTFLAKISFFKISPFWKTVIAIELADLAFAIDQVLVSVAYTEKYLLIVLSSFAAILMLRISAMLLTKVIDWFPSIEQIAYAVVGFVGLKLVASYWEIEIPKQVSVTLTLAAFLIPISFKLLRDRFARVRISP
jgi:YkoY family integral membrane protein